MTNGNNDSKCPKDNIKKIISSNERKNTESTKKDYFEIKKNTKTKIKNNCFPKENYMPYEPFYF